MTMRVEVAENWNHLQELLFSSIWNAALGRYRSPWAFRGLSDSAYPLETTLIRLAGPYAELEKHLLRNFVKYAHRDVVEKDSYWHWLAVAQHHGLPTRLLDWTHSPLIATHFATCNTDKFDLDGVVWCIDYESCHRCLPDRMREVLDREGANMFTTEMLARAVNTMEEFDAMAEDPFLLFFEPPSMDDRIINQFALFSVMSQSTLGLESWIREHPGLCRKIVIPAGLKWEVRDKLDQSNITERVLFPGLDGLGQWLTRQYSPKDTGR